MYKQIHVKIVVSLVGPKWQRIRPANRISHSRYPESNRSAKGKRSQSIETKMSGNYIVVLVCAHNISVVRRLVISHHKQSLIVFIEHDLPAYRRTRSAHHTNASLKEKGSFGDREISTDTPKPLPLVHQNTGIKERRKPKSFKDKPGFKFDDCRLNS